MLVWVTVKSLSVRIDSSPLLAPVMCLATCIVAESLVAPTLSTLAARRDYPAAVFATDHAVARGHEPVHLKIHGTQEVVERPNNVRLIRDTWPCIRIKGRHDMLAAVFVNDAFGCLLGASQANPERIILVFSGTYRQPRQPPLENIYVTVIGQQSPYRPLFIVQDGLVQRKYDPRPPPRALY
jgi:hypothetical protein